MKTCCKCRTPKPLTEFAKNKAKKDGLNLMCKTCHHEYGKAHYEANKGYYHAKSRKRTKAIQERLGQIIDALKDRPCMDCKQKFPPCAMDFDHVEDNKVASVSDLRSRTVSEEVIIAEIAKCDLVCANCHRIRTHNRRLTPLS